LQHGDFPLHSAHWADFDGDSHADLFFYSGMEDVFETYVFLNRTTVDRFAVTNFVLGYHEPHSYAVVVDLNGDNVPELLVPEPQDEENEAADSCFTSLADSELSQQVEKVYVELCGSFASFNFTYNLPSHPVINMALPDRIRIISLRGAQTDVTRDYTEHLRWRLGIIDRLRQSAPSTCAPRLDDTERYLRALLDGTG